jgi:cytochrome c
LVFACQAGAAEDDAAFKALAKKKGCFNCHRMDKPVLGPSLIDVGRKYRDDASAPDRLFGVIRNGSKGGVWGVASMPRYAGLSDDEINLMVRHILSLK